MSESQMGTMLESRDREPLSHSLEDYLEAIVDLAGGPNEPIRFMTEAIGIDSEIANYEACQIEHGISAESFKKWEEYLTKQGITLEL